MAKPTDIDRSVADLLELAEKLKAVEKPPKPGTAHIKIAKLDAIIAAEDGQIPLEARKKDTARQLDELYVETGDQACWNAARALAPRPRNAPTKEDDVFVRRMGALIRTGYAEGPSAAARIVAPDIPEINQDAVEERLRRKYRKRFGQKSAS